MSGFDDLVKQIEDNNFIITTILGISSMIFIYYNKITYFGDKFTIVVSSLLAFVAIFYSVIVISDFLKKMERITIIKINDIVSEIRKLSLEENKNIIKKNFKENSDICIKKSDLYLDLSNIKNNKINKNLFISALFLIIILILTLDFIPLPTFNSLDYRPYFLLGLFWIVIDHIIKIIIIFYRVSSD